MADYLICASLHEEAKEGWVRVDEEGDDPSHNGSVDVQPGRESWAAVEGAVRDSATRGKGGVEASET
jgi:hypothetical protein